jgi:hypothetical protein
MRIFGVCLLLLAGVVCPAAHGQGFTSGLLPAAPGKPYTKMPHSFDVHTFNGRNANRFHCLVCENDIHPTLLLFLKEPAEGKQKALEDLFGKLDALVEKYQAMEKYADVTTVAVYAVFLSPAAQTSLDNASEADPASLVKEATERRALYQRMKEWAGKTKKVVIATAIPEAAKGYNINPAASLTGLYYYRLNVLENFAFEEFTEADVEPIITRMEMRLQSIIATLEAGRKKAAK